MTYRELIRVWSKQRKMPRVAAAEQVTSLFELIANRVRDGEDVHISGLGKFTLAKVRRRSNFDGRIVKVSRIVFRQYPSSVRAMAGGDFGVRGMVKFVDRQAKEW